MWIVTLKKINKLLEKGRCEEGEEEEVRKRGEGREREKRESDREKGLPSFFKEDFKLQYSKMAPRASLTDIACVISSKYCREVRKFRRCTCAVTIPAKVAKFGVSLLAFIA